MCRVGEPEPGGYSAVLLPSEIAAFIPSQGELTPGQTVPATFVCMSNERALMTFAYMLGTTERVQGGLPSEAETAFAVWADSYPRNFEVKRAIDMIMPHPDGRADLTMRGGDFNIENLMRDLEASKLTGCIKAESEVALSRSAALLYKGRAVGCVYGKKNHESKPDVEGTLRAMLADLQLEETQLLIYALPIEVVLCMSSLFFGIPVDSQDSVPLTRHFPKLVSRLVEREETACLAVGDSTGFEVLGYIYRGEQFGSFSILDQRFETGLELLLEACSESDNSRSDAYLLPKEMTSPSVLFGYSLGNIITSMNP